MALDRYVAEEIALDCQDGLMSRREALRRLGLMGLSAAAATTLLAACGDDDDEPTAAATTAPPSGTSEPITGTGEEITFKGPRGDLIGSWAAAADPKGAVLIIHENRGLTDHFKALPTRFAADGYSALALDLLSDEGGTKSMDEGAAQAALGAAPQERFTADMKAALDELEKRAADQKLAIIGFCFGGGQVWQLLQVGETRLAAAAPFYGPAPDAADFSKSKQAAVLAVYGELDARVNGSRPAAEAALKTAGNTHEIKTFPGADHAFFNDTGQRYNKDAATQAYTDVLAWFAKHLA
jgi:carboxymethylenebutenolidase